MSREKQSEREDKTRFLLSSSGVYLKLNDQQKILINQCVQLGVWGNTPAEVTRRLLDAKLLELIRNNEISLPRSIN